MIDAVLTIPHDQTVSLWTYSKTLKFTDSSGKPLSAASATPIAPAVGELDHYVPLSVSK